MAPCLEEPRLRLQHQSGGGGVEARRPRARPQPAVAGGRRAPSLPVRPLLLARASLQPPMRRREEWPRSSTRSLPPSRPWHIASIASRASRGVEPCPSAEAEGVPRQAAGRHAATSEEGRCLCRPEAPRSAGGSSPGRQDPASALPLSPGARCSASSAPHLPGARPPMGRTPRLPAPRGRGPTRPAWSRQEDSPQESPRRPAWASSARSKGESGEASWTCAA